MNSRLRFLLYLYQLLAGACDTGTGLLLVFAPALTMTLMGLTVQTQPAAFLGYIGIFVLSVGLSYLWLAIQGPISSTNCERWRMQWQITALVRTLVAIFVTWQVATGGLEGRWITVALTDAIFAIVQWTGLRKGWLKRVD